MKLTILGKYGPYPQGENTACSGYLVENEDTKILVDCGPGVLGRLMNRIDLKDLDAIFLTHLHFDHTSDLLPLRYYLDDLNVDLNVYTALTKTPYEEILLNHSHFIINDINESTIVKIGSLNLSFFRMEHSLLNHGILISGNVKLGITGDTTYCKNVLTLARKSDYLLADCSKPIGFKGPHMGAESAFEILKDSNVKILATHVTPYNDTSYIFADEERIISVEELKTYVL